MYSPVLSASAFGHWAQGPPRIPHVVGPLWAFWLPAGPVRLLAVPGPDGAS